MKSKEQSITETINHWKRMIKWARKRPKENKVNSEVMFIAIKEKWRGNFCPLCLKYNTFDDCSKCPIYVKYCVDCQKIGWVEVDCSQTWGDWVKNAETFLKKIEGLK